MAVVIGINDYGQGIPALKTAVSDARAIADHLATGHGYSAYIKPSTARRAGRASWDLFGSPAGARRRERGCSCTSPGTAGGRR
ncbi:MAG: hypothetical protein R3F43_02780 [bacterium]